MTTQVKGRTAEAYIASEYAEATTTPRTTTSPSYVSTDWAMERRFLRIVADDAVRQAQVAQEQLAEATLRVQGDHSQELIVAAQEFLRLEGKEVLRRLAADYAFAWVDLSRMIGVSVPAIRKWRLDGRITAENQSKLAYLAAFARILRDRGVSAASWLSAPMIPGYTVAPKNLYTQERAAVLLDLACDGRDPEQVLNSVEPDWRARYDAHGFSVARFSDGTYGVVSQ